MNAPIIARVWRSAETLDVLRTLTGVETELLRSLQEALTAGSECGEDVRKLADRVQSLLDTDRSSAMLITRNTVGYVQSRAHHETATKARLTHKVWLHTPQCPCLGHDLAGRRYGENPIPIGEHFEINGTRMLYPRDFSCGRPQECVGCQCVAICKYIRSP